MSITLAHGGLPEGLKPYQLVTLIKQVARSTDKVERISRTAVSVLEYCISCCRDGDFLKGKICGVWEQPATIAAKLGISTRVLHNAEAELRASNLIERTSVAHARRYGERRGGEIISLAGISLRPLIDGYARLVAIRDAADLQRQAMSSLQHEISQLRRQIREAGDDEIADRADAILPGGRTSRITQKERLEQIKTDLEALLVLIELPSGAPKSSDQTEENFAPIILKEDSSKNCSGASPQSAARSQTVSMTPAGVAELASADYQALLAANGGSSWPNLIETSAIACSWLGISQRVWGKACFELGRERAALCVLAIDRNSRLPRGHRYRGRVPEACLAGMAAKQRRQGFEPGPLLMAIQGYQGEPECSTSIVECENGPPDITGVSSIGALTQNLFKMATKASAGGAA
jgi:replication initiation protein RepC